MDLAEDIVPPSLLQHLSQLDLLGDMTRMSIVWRAPYTILAHFYGPSDSCLTIDIGTTSWSEHTASRNWLSLLRSALPVWSKIDELLIDYHSPSDRAQPAGVDALGEFMQTIPSLRKLVLVDMHDAMTHWFRLLSTNPPFCPGLVALHVDWSEWIPDLIPGLLDVAAVRTQQGHPIAELTVTYRARDESEMTLDVQRSLKTRFLSINTVALNGKMEMEHPKFVFHTTNTYWPIIWSQGRLIRPPRVSDDLSSEEDFTFGFATPAESSDDDHEMYDNDIDGPADD
ncbi:hypothetical protein B0H21DRAFT_833876 [Amylocystis lapponica]|nr:hypothetical protein B0H21DRAFT_833876 [Amylocystis lapponica]